MQIAGAENTNKRIRRFMPGDTDLAAVSQRKLIQLARHLNDQPRMCLSYRTPAEVFRAHFARWKLNPYPKNRRDALRLGSPVDPGN
ncbi:hypothetical protein D9M68_272780 [compost metagenome]